MKKTIVCVTKLLVIVAVTLQLSFIVLDFSGQQDTINQLKHHLKMNLSCVFS